MYFTIICYVSPADQEEKPRLVSKKQKGLQTKKTFQEHQS